MTSPLPPCGAAREARRRRDTSRRAFLQAVGGATATAAISQLFPLATATELFAQAAKPEKTDLKASTSS